MGARVRVRMWEGVLIVTDLPSQRLIDLALLCRVPGSSDSQVSPARTEFHKCTSC